MRARASEGAGGFGQGACGRDHVVYEPDIPRNVAPGAERSPNVSSAFLPREPRLARRIADTLQGDRVDADPAISSEHPGQARRGVESARAKPARMQGNRNNQRGRRPRHTGGGFPDQLANHRPGGRIEPRDPRRRILESVNPILHVAREGDGGDARDERAAGAVAGRTEAAGFRDGRGLAQRAPGARNPLQPPVAARAQRRRTSGAGTAGRTPRRHHQIEQAGKAGAQRGEAEWRSNEQAGKAGAQRGEHQVHPRDRGVGWVYGSTISERPVISSGTGRPSRSRTVGARSASPPFRSRRSSASRVIQ